MGHLELRDFDAGSRGIVDIIDTCFPSSLSESSDSVSSSSNSDSCGAGDLCHHGGVCTTISLYTFGLFSVGDSTASISATSDSVNIGCSSNITSLDTTTSSFSSSHALH